MGQRINMQFTIDIDELPAETKRILTKTEQQIEALSTELEEISKMEILTLSCAESLDEVRKSISAIDYGISDVVNIIKGYVSYKSAPETQEQQATQDELEQEAQNGQTAPDPYYDLERVTELQEKIEEFKNQQAQHQMKSQDDKEPPKEHSDNNKVT